MKDKQSGTSSQSFKVKSALMLERERQKRKRFESMVRRAMREHNNRKKKY